jgi:8-oxo-dGTP pyrophosphatase MutT (NUDIX family)
LTVQQKKSVNLQAHSKIDNLMDLEKLQYRFQQELPGVKSHLKMAPAHREAEFQGIHGKDFNPRLSAVLVLLFHENDALKVVFIRRGEYVGIHSGQIAFPGGRYEEEDVDLRETAMREAEEEIGVTRTSYEIIGQLSDLYVPPSNFLVRAFVAYTHQRPVYVPDRREVQEVIELDLSHFFNSNHIKIKDFPAHNSVNNTSAPYFDVEGVTIWGATAMMLTELVDLLIGD